MGDEERRADVVLKKRIPESSAISSYGAAELHDVSRATKRTPTGHARRSLATALALAIASLAGMGVDMVNPDVADAVTYSSVMNSDGAYRYCVNTSLAGCASQGTVPKNRKLKLNCYAQGTWATGTYGSDRYFHITTELGTRGFVHSSRVNNQTTVGKCSDHSGVAPARWAAEHIGETKPTTAEKNGQNITFWSGYCLLFAQDAYRLTNGSPKSGLATALIAYRYYRDTKKVTHSNMGPDDIAIGSMVFWGTDLGSAGHVAIYVGNGKVVNTVGLEGQAQPIGFRSLGTAVGWVHPADV